MYKTQIDNLIIRKRHHTLLSIFRILYKNTTTPVSLNKLGETLTNQGVTSWFDGTLRKDTKFTLLLSPVRVVYVTFYLVSYHNLLLPFIRIRNRSCQQELVPIKNGVPLKPSQTSVKSRSRGPHMISVGHLPRSLRRFLRYYVFCRNGRCGFCTRSGFTVITTPTLRDQNHWEFLLLSCGRYKRMSIRPSILFLPFYVDIPHHRNPIPFPYYTLRVFSIR